MATTYENLVTTCENLVTTCEKLAEMTETGRLTIPREARRVAGVDGHRSMFQIETSEGVIILRAVQVLPKIAPRLSPNALELIDEARRAGEADVTFEDLEATAISE